MLEVWKDVIGFEGYYKISNFGNVKTVERYDKKRKRTIPERLRKPVCVHGYLYCELWKDGKHERRAVHRMVAGAFLPPLDGRTEVNHKDGNKANNRLENLEWCTHSENESHAYNTHLKMPYNRTGKNNPMYGKHQTEKAKSLISSVHKGRRHTEETREKMSAAHKGIKFTQTHKANLGKRKKKKKKGQRRMTNGVETKFVLRDDIPQKLSEGWTFTSKRRE